MLQKYTWSKLISSNTPGSIKTLQILLQLRNALSLIICVDQTQAVGVVLVNHVSSWWITFISRSKICRAEVRRWLVSCWGSPQQDGCIAARNSGILVKWRKLQFTLKSSRLSQSCSPVSIAQIPPDTHTHAQPEDPPAILPWTEPNRCNRVSTGLNVCKLSPKGVFNSPGGNGVPPVVYSCLLLLFPGSAVITRCFPLPHRVSSSSHLSVFCWCSCSPLSSGSCHLFVNYHNWTGRD